MLVLFILVHWPELWVGCEMHINRLGEKISKYLILICLNDFYPFLCLYFCFLTENITKGKKPSVSLLELIFMDRQIFWINTENAGKRGYLFWCILYAIYRETSSPTLEKKCCLVRNLTYSLEWNAMKKVCKLVRPEYMEIFPADRQRVLNEFLVGVSSVTQEPLSFTTPCSAAILPP